MRIQSLVVALLSLVSSLGVNASSAWAAQEPSLPELRKAAFLSSDSCQNVIRSDDRHLFIGYGPYLPREHTSGQVQIIDIAHPENKQFIRTKDSVMDVAAVGNRLFVLTYTAIEEWNLAALTPVATYPTYIIDRKLEYKEHATGFYFHNNQFFISHGRLGFSVFDITKNRLVDQRRILSDQLPLESMVMDIAGSGDKAILAVDNFSLTKPGQPAAFRGLVVLDLNTHTVVRQIPGLDPGAESISVAGNSVIVGMHPPVWKYDLQEVLSNDKAQPVYMTGSFPGTEGHGVKKLFFDEKYMYGCFLERAPNGVYSLKPTVFNRKEVLLD